MTEKLLTYALGRGVEYYDMPAVRTDRRATPRRRLPLVVASILGIVKSAPFQMRRSRVMIVTKKALSAPHGAARPRRDAGAAAARRHGAGASGARARRRREPAPRVSASSTCRTASMMHADWTPAAEGADFELTPILEPLDAVPRSDAGRDRARQQAGGRVPGEPAATTRALGARS